jgi:hypothetical protein
MGDAAASGGARPGRGTAGWLSGSVGTSIAERAADWGGVPMVALIGSDAQRAELGDPDEAHGLDPEDADRTARGG